MRRFFAPTALAGALFALGGSAAAWAQSTLTYQGQVFGAHGPVDAIYDMTFRLYESAEGGEALWSESFANVPVVDGVFLVELGVQNPLEEIARREAPLYIGISIGDNAEMTPRMLVGTALRAQWAAHAHDVEGEDSAEERCTIESVSFGQACLDALLGSYSTRLEGRHRRLA